MRGFEAIQAGHTNVEHHDIGSQLLGLLHQFLAIGRFADNLPARFRLQQRAHSPAHQFVIVGDEDPEFGQVTPPAPPKVQFRFRQPERARFHLGIQNPGETGLDCSASKHTPNQNTSIGIGRERLSIPCETLCINRRPPADKRGAVAEEDSSAGGEFAVSPHRDPAPPEPYHVRDLADRQYRETPVAAGNFL